MHNIQGLLVHCVRMHRKFLQPTAVASCVIAVTPDDASHDPSEAEHSLDVEGPELLNQGSFRDRGLHSQLLMFRYFQGYRDV